MENIFKRLPVKTLIRFQCVCKSWKALVQTPSFISQHHQNPLLLLHHYTEPLIQLSFLDSNMQDKRIPKTPSLSTSFNTHLVASCNGLLCLTINETYCGLHFPPSIVLWNPAIRESIIVPRTTAIVCSYPWLCHYIFRFGFSPLINDFKIVKIYTDSDHTIFGVVVFSLSTRSWKEIEFGNDLETVNIFESQTVSVNGAIFWTGRKKKGGGGGVNRVRVRDVIVSFDLANEVFTLIPMPKVSMKLCVYDDKLAGLSHTQPATSPKSPWFIDLWVLEEESTIGSCMKTNRWVKKCTCGPCPSFIDLGVIWNNQIAGVGSSKSNFVSEMKFKV